jgi:uncharacterized protein (TIGR02145 family)
VWLDRNLGATQVATSFDDSAAYGDLYQWGRAKDGHEDRTRNSTSATLTSGIDTGANDLFIMTSALPFDWVAKTADNNGLARMAAWANDGVNDICPAGFSVPTKAELKEDIIDMAILCSSPLV